MDSLSGGGQFFVIFFGDQNVGTRSSTLGELRIGWRFVACVGLAGMRETMRQVRGRLELPERPGL
jgi:hypothetical protein